MTVRGNSPVFCRKSDGFTLLEVMLVLCLIALVSSAVIPTLKPSGGTHLNMAASKFRVQMQQLHERALLLGVNYGVFIQGNEYSFVYFDVDGWKPVTGVRHLKKVVLPDTLSLSFIPGESVWAASLEREAAAQRDRKQAAADEQHQLPAIQVWASGEMTPGTVRFVSEQSALAVKLDELGGVRQ